MSRELAAEGLVVDIVGAIWLVSTIFRENPADFLPTAYPPNTSVQYRLLVSRARDRADVVVGLGLLSSGFLLQLASLWVRGSVPVLRALLGGCVLIAAAWRVAPWVQRMSVQSYAAAAIADHGNAFDAIEQIKRSMGVKDEHWAWKPPPLDPPPGDKLGAVERVPADAQIEALRAMCVGLWGKKVWDLVEKGGTVQKWKNTG